MRAMLLVQNWGKMTHFSEQISQILLFSAMTLHYHRSYKIEAEV